MSEKLNGLIKKWLDKLYGVLEWSDGEKDGYIDEEIIGWANKKMSR